MNRISFITHFAAAIIITIVLLLIYASVQQSYRTAANDPQLQIARDISNALNEDKSIKNLLPADTIDIAESLGLFTEIFDRNGKPIQSTGLLNGSAPQPPQGIFNFTKANDEDILTWQPQKDVRMAMVFEKVNSPYVGFVAAGRSLKETEVRESNLIKMIGIAWIACMGVLLLHFLVQVYLSKRIAK
ncbi:MAG: hypothetical protein ABI405_13305 [Parafilimonas sp.]